MDCRFPLSYGGKLHQSWRRVATEYSSTVCGITTTCEFPLILLDLYGQGYSDAPQMTYNPNLYTIQFALLMQHLRWDKAAIVGVSMGGGIAAAFTASVCRSSLLDWKKDRNRTEPNCKRPDHRLRLHKF